MKITIYIDEQQKPDAAEWVRQQRNRSRAIAKLIEQAARDTPLTLGTMRAMVDDVIRMALRDELKTLAGRVSLQGENEPLHPDEEDPDLVALLDGMEFGNG